MKKSLFMLALLLIASVLHGGVHTTGKADAFTMKNLSVSAPPQKKLRKFWEKFTKLPFQ